MTYSTPHRRLVQSERRGYSTTPPSSTRQASAAAGTQRRAVAMHPDKKIRHMLMEGQFGLFLPRHVSYPPAITSSSGSNTMRTRACRAWAMRRSVLKEWPS